MPSTKKVRNTDLLKSSSKNTSKSQKKLGAVKCPPTALSEEEIGRINSQIKTVIQLRKVSNRKQLYEDVGIICNYLIESIEFGELKVKGKYTKQMLADLIIKAF